MAMMKCCGNVSTCLAQTEETPEGSTLPQVKRMLVDSIKQLKPDLKIGDEEAMSVSRLVYESMTVEGRVYHAMQHVFDISKNTTDPIHILSALFHDVVYHSIDKKFLLGQQDIIEGIILSKDDKFSLSADTGGSELIEKVAAIFGIEKGADLPKSGTNEFISCIIGVKTLSQWLDLSHLLQIAVCIEATIPFRPVLEGKTPMDRLYDRLKAVCPEQLDEWLVASVVQGVKTANFDLCSFDSDDRDFFLDSSWKLIPEARPLILQPDCPLLEWDNELKALEGRTKFLMGAVPKIFQSFGGVPNDEEMVTKQNKARENLNVMWEYTKVRQLHSMVLVAMVRAMGGDPTTFALRKCLTMDAPSVGGRSSSSLTSTEKEVRHWLVNGRRACFDWDPAISPLGAYLFDLLGSKGIDDALTVGNNQSSDSHDLLKHLPKEVVVTLSSTLSAVFVDRAEGFLRVPESMGIVVQ